MYSLLRFAGSATLARPTDNSPSSVEEGNDHSATFFFAARFALVARLFSAFSPMAFSLFSRLSSRFRLRFFLAAEGAVWLKVDLLPT